ncbi:MAG: plastocyanin/azurin family copper-binding protein [Chloroflexota bacterium]
MIIDVAIRDHAFAPAAVEAARPVTVRWTHFDPADHDVVWDDVTSPVLKLGGTYERRFDQPGTFAYRCTIHVGMRGVVTVR